MYIRLYLLMMGLDAPETCTGWRNTLRISCASSLFFFTRLYRDARSTKHKIPPSGLREGQRHAVLWNVGAKILLRMPGVASYILAHYYCNSFLLNYPQARALCKCCSNCCRKPVMWRLGLEVKQLPLDHPLWATRRSLVQYKDMAPSGVFRSFCETLHCPQSS